MSKFLVYKASAGSGKTYTLVKEYLKIVLNNPDDFRHTLAITFTNKAADEMKERIIKHLIELSGGKNPRLEKALIEEGISCDIRQNALIVLKNILHKYFYFSVLTIDSFFQRVIRSFSKELNLHIGYTLEMDSKEVMEKITDELLDTIGEDKELTAFLEDYVYQNIDENKDWKIDKQVKNVGMEIFRERYWELKQQFEDDVIDKSKVEKIISKLRKIVFGFENDMKDISVKAGKILSKYKLDIIDFSYATGGVMGYLCINIGEKKKYEPGVRTIKAREDKNSWFTKKSPKSSVIIKAVDEGLFELLGNAIKLWEEEFTGYNTAKVLLKTIHVLGVFKDLIDKLKIYRDENKIMLISDANNILQKITSDMEGAPFVYEKIGNNYKYFLIDEFQDTSTFQWLNLLPLIINSLSEGNISLVVGDAKQSIYRWRNGNMQLLLGKIYEHLSLFKDVIDDRSLADNHRSRKNIVDFNNALFSKTPAFIEENILEKKSPLIENAYQDVSQVPRKDKVGGYVNIEYIPYVKNSEIKPYDIAVNSVIKIVNDLQSENIPLKDILILTRKNKEASGLAKVLTENNIPVVSSDSLFLFNSPCVKLLVNTLKYIADNKNFLAKTEALYNYSLIYTGTGDFEKIFSDNIAGKGTLFNSSIPRDFFGSDEAQNSSVNYNKINPYLNNFSLYELVESLIRIFGLTSSPDAYMMRFMDIILDYSAKYSSDVMGFLGWWEESKNDYSIIVPGDAEAVRIMTIHKAKGLQSPVVIVPFISWSVDVESNKSTMWVTSYEEEPFDSAPYLVKVTGTLMETYFNEQYQEERELTCLDNLNLLYVAFTRPVERLYAVIAERGSGKRTAGEMLNQILTTDSAFNKYYSPELQIFEIGEKTLYSNNSEKDQRTVHLKKYISNDLYRRIIIRSRHDSLKDKDFSDKTQWGVLVHKALAYVNQPDDTGLAIQKMVQEGLITSYEIDKLRNSIEQILTHEKIKSWFTTNYTVLPERSILMPDGETIRPDRVLVKGDKAIIIDYKTGIEKEEHIMQVNKYSESLKQMGYNQIEKYLLYVEGPYVKQIP